MIFAYSLGKAQRLLENLDLEIGEIYVHGAIDNTNSALIKSGVKLRDYTLVNNNIPKSAYRGSIVIAPPATMNSNWMKIFQPYRTAFA